MKLKLMRETGKIRLALFRAPARIAALVICLAAVPVLSGCSLALAEALPGPGQDRLAGIFVTTDYILLGEPEIQVNNQGEITIKETTEKIYGTLNKENDSTQPPIVFPGLEGYGIYSLTAPEDETHEATGARYMTTDFHFANVHYYVLDQEDSVEADLYITADSHVAYYFNPVYQQEDGQFYLLPGSGISSDSPEGMHFSHSIAESFSQTENGDETVTGYRFAVTIIAEEAPENPEVLFLNSSDQVTGRLSAHELDALLQADVPELSVPEDVACLILKQDKSSGTAYTAYDPASEYLEYKEARGDGPLYVRQLHLLWP